MAVYKRSNGIYFVQFQFQSKTYIKSSGSTRKSDAQELERKMKDDLRKHVTLGLPKEITCIDAINNYLKSKEDKSAYNTTKGVANWYIPRLKGLFLHQITTVKFHELIEEKKSEGAKPNTLMSYKQLIMGVNKLAKKQGFLPATFESPEVKRVKKRLRYLTMEEEAKLLHALDPKNRRNVAQPGFEPKYQERYVRDNYDFVILLLDTGTRLSEIANLRWEDVDVENGLVRLWRSKVQNESTLKLPNRSWLIINRRYRTKIGEYVFTDSTGTRPKQSVAHFRKIFDRAGFPDVTLHTLRKTFASRLIQNGASLYEVKELLGHSSINTTMIYAGLDQDATTTKARDVLNEVNKNVHKEQMKRNLRVVA